MSMKTMIGVLLISFALLLTHCTAYAGGPLMFDPALSNLFNIYSPSFAVENGTPTLYTGGWLTSEECRFGGSKLGDCEDAIYRSELTDTWSWPVKVFAIPGHHVNDPSVIIPPSTEGVDRSWWRYMYYTIAPAAANAGLAGTPLHIALATQATSGAPWEARGVVLGMPEQTDGCGAWMPSALVMGDEIWVYYNLGDPCYSDGRTLYLTKFKANGWEQISTVRVQIPFPIANPDVSRFRDGLQLWGDSAYGIARLVSDDWGLSFYVPEGTTLPAIAVTSTWTSIHTPHCWPFFDGFAWCFWAESKSPEVFQFDTIRTQLMWYEK